SPIIIDNLVKSTIFKATMDLAKPWALSVFKDNAGVIAFDNEYAVCMKTETHNRPSAIEPYGGAATGIGGCIRDVMGTGIGAKPFASTAIFCLADPKTPFESLPAGVMHPYRTAQRAAAGSREYGDIHEVPFVNGAIFFDQRYVGNPIVLCGNVGIMPRKFADKGKAVVGDHVIVIGGRTGRDGIHGATFSSDVVTNTHANEFSHAVQLGNAIVQKKMLDVILQARDMPEGPLYHAITDCGAGGFSSAVGEMGEKTGATVELERAPVKYQGLSYAEIWISEAQERMVLAVPAANVQKLLDLCKAANVEATDIGIYDGSGKLNLHYQGNLVAQMDMSFIHDGIPKPTRKAVYTPPTRTEPHIATPKNYADTLHALLKMPAIASKSWVIRSSDPNPNDAAVVRPLPDSPRAVVLSNGGQPRFGDIDPYQMTLNGIDEAIRNLVCGGGDPNYTAILDNFCWPKCTDPQNLGALVKACQACYDGAIAYSTPFISGKDSLSNEFITDKGERIQVPYTLLISAMSVIEDATKCITMDAKKSGNHLLLVGLTKRELGGSHYFALHNQTGNSVPVVDLKVGPATAKAVAKLIADRLVASAHDLSEGGLAIALAEMLFSGNLGATVDLSGVAAAADANDDAVRLFSESASRYLLEIHPENFDAIARVLKAAGVPFGVIGSVTDSKSLKIRSLAGSTLMDEPLAALKKSWLSPLD
ncbi:MAG: AIR synthase-related protein, partial [Phycisphaerales bacterium]|nr:AIR synthase-related protein [Phycisphaerales bacterium]